MASDLTADVRVGSALWITVLGLLITAALAVYLVAQGKPVTDVVALVGVFTSLIGTLVGAFLGIQVGAQGKAKAEEDKAKAEEITRRALAVLPQEQADMVLGR
ncbi:hypothetical protein [Hymenobacter sp. CRA2]|uniref:hypothetical protein n=1 Tax=Hymenobacter sp. CRA2 TaxID=1955620 RepID=UPI00098F8BE9|nr:hypothetical protein [Hymenobacter sp. CRA2]OON68212.1 hypothetical protein B0919_13720 [Hymenobacter sp. CRA2]